MAEKDETRTATASTTTKSALSLSEEYRQVVSKLEEGGSTDSATAVVSAVVASLEGLQERVARASLVSRNERLDDVVTGHIQYLALEHYLAKALTQLPIVDRRNMNSRLAQLHRACDLWLTFFTRLEQLEMVSKKEIEEYHALVEQASAVNGDEAAGGEVSGCGRPLQFFSPSRDVKIARYNAKKQTQQEILHLQALSERRNRLGVIDEDEMDGHDQESLERSLALKSLELAKQEAMEEWSSVVQELPMLAIMVTQAEQNDRETERYSISSSSASRGPSSQQQQADHRQNSHTNRPPLQVTHITKDATGNLTLQRQEISSTVFRRGWNQPTMSLEELAEREVAAAMERDVRHKQAEANQKEAPRKYGDLKRDGMEDNAELVDASAPLDRAWDDFKDENPRGSGNKRGDVGDRNF